MKKCCGGCCLKESKRLKDLLRCSYVSWVLGKEEEILRQWIKQKVHWTEVIKRSDHQSCDMACVFLDLLYLNAFRVWCVLEGCT